MVRAWILAMAGALPMHHAVAQESPLTLRAGGGYYWDSNVYRLAESAPDPLSADGTAGRSDRYLLAYAGLRFEQSYSLQRVSLDVVERILRYDRFDALNRDELDYRGEWAWRIGSRLGGALRADRAESLIGFEDTRGQQENVSIVTNEGFSLEGQLSSYWHLLGGLSQSQRRNRQTFLALPDSRQRGGDVGLRFLSPAQNSVTYMARRRRGTNDIVAVDFVNLIDDAFEVREREVSFLWASGGNHTINGRLTRVEYTYENIPQRNFSGYSGLLSHAWAFTEAVTLNLSAQRSITPWSADTTASFRTDDTLSVAPTWRISDQTSMEGRVFRTSSKFRAPGDAAGGGVQSDATRGLRLNARWMPRERITFSVSLQHEERSSTLGTSGYKATIAGLDAAVSF